MGDKKRILLRNGVLTLGAGATVALVVLGFQFGQSVPFVNQWPLYEALRNTAAIIFAVVGAWLAIIYPERLKLSFGAPAETKGSSAKLLLLLTPAVSSTFILMIVLMVGVLAPVFKQMPFVLERLEFFRGISFAFFDDAHHLAGCHRVHSHHARRVPAKPSFERDRARGDFEELR